MLTMDLAVLLAIIVFIRIRRPVQPRTRSDQVLGVTVILVLGLLLAPTSFGQGLLDAVRQIVASIAEATR